MPEFDTREFEYADVQVRILGTTLTGLRGLTYKVTVEKEHIYAQGRLPKAIQTGNKKYDGVLSILKSDYDALDRAAIAAGYSDITDVPASQIVITCCYQKEGSAMLATDSLFGVSFTDAEDGMKQGEKFKEISLPFLFLRKKKVA